jgi:hypothetical protein
MCIGLTVWILRIIGQICINYAIKGKHAQFSIRNEGFPCYTMGMRNVLITFSGIESEEKVMMEGYYY